MSQSAIHAPVVAIVAAVFLSQLATAHAESAAERHLRTCISGGKLLEKALRAGTADSSQFARWEKNCVSGTNAAEIKGMSGFAEIETLHATVQKLSERAASEYAECHNDELESDCIPASTTFAKYCRAAAKRAKSDFGYSGLEKTVEEEHDKLVDEINGFPAAMKRYDEFHAKWKKCYGRQAVSSPCQLGAADHAACEMAPAAMRRRVHNIVVGTLDQYDLDEATKNIKDDPDQARHAAGKAKETAKSLLAMLSRLPKDYHSKNPALEAQVARADKILGALAKANDARVASLGCPRGVGALSAAHRKLVTAEFNAREARVIRPTGPKKSWRTGLISNEGIPVVVCGERRSDAKVCLARDITVFREKPPGRAWTSWTLMIGGDHQINCARMR